MTMTMRQLVIFGIFVAAVQTAPDFGVDPLFPKNMDCCKFPDPKWDDFEADCSKYNDAFNKYGDLCAMDCIFNVSQVLPDDELNMVNARTLVSNLYNGNPDFIQTFDGALEKCQTRMVQLKAAGVTTHGPHGSSYCRPLPMMYVLCTVREVFINCPASAWTSSTECEKLN